MLEPQEIMMRALSVMLRVFPLAFMTQQDSRVEDWAARVQALENAKKELDELALSWETIEKHVKDTKAISISKIIATHQEVVTEKHKACSVDLVVALENQTADIKKAMEVDDEALQKLVAEVEKEKIYRDRAQVLFKLAATEGAHKLQTAWEASTAAMARIEQAKNHILVADVLSESEARIKTAQEVMTRSEIVLNALFGMVCL